MTAKALYARWDNRDRLYAVRRISGIPSPLTDDERRGVMWNRMWEVRHLLPEAAQTAALARLAGWHAPEVVF
jgi:hypothetical protein